jgi:hypothetical protein
MAAPRNKRTGKLMRIPLNVPEPELLKARGRGLPYFETRFLFDLEVAFGETASFDLLGYPKRPNTVEKKETS